MPAIFVGTRFGSLMKYSWRSCAWTSPDDRLPSLAAELVGRDVAAIFATDVPAAFAAKAATKTLPIVFIIGADPVKVGLVDSFNRPGGNLTGVSVLVSILGPKRLMRRKLNSRVSAFEPTIGPRGPLYLAAPSIVRCWQMRTFQLGHFGSEWTQC
jgi:hypothetical protein